jgi:hypothetical protein
LPSSSAVGSLVTFRIALAGIEVGVLTARDADVCAIRLATCTRVREQAAGLLDIVRV